MRKISGQLLSSKPISLSRAAKLISRFAAVDNGSSPVVSLYLQRTADAFNNLVQFHSKRLRTSDVESSPDRKREPKPAEDRPERNSDGAAAEDSNGGGNPNSVEVQNSTSEERKRKKKSRSDSAVDDSKERSGNNPEANSSCVDEVQNLQNGEMKKKKKKNKKSKSAEVGLKANSIGNPEIEVEYMQIEEKEQTKEENTKKIKKKKSHSAV
ncbi:hypothetical protein ABFS82_05G054600 [Erythranthe guttata]|uniref:Uncharacterized protein n=1 Tax=Erythranthe guttata TaxID=4155 RepID=A0A022R5N1_ERYGU|nr:PREDICTED: uncharacterized protein LOC105959963 [Erythranthe guttata]EYU35531.1 hypothetical protein MIMGU_mgv1a013797mg [Erythranthe guttata]|eukprot:XP_012839583.1 PREDICTED: uncharacterized protein LOC105959963 [Erythranthe guttata]